MDVPLLIRQRLEALGLEQRDLARAAHVTESYISQLLTRKKSPPAPGRTDIYDRMDKFLQLPRGELAKLAALQRKEELKKALGEGAIPAPLFPEDRAWMLRKCRPERADHVRAIVERQAFGELERLITQKLLDVAKRVVKDELANEKGIRAVAKRAGRSHEALRVRDLDPFIDSWDIDLTTFAMQVVPNPRVTTLPVKRFEFVERSSGDPLGEEPGLKAFLDDPTLSAGATPEETAWLRGLTFERRRPTPLFYYRQLQSLRDPLHFDGAGAGASRSGKRR